MSQSKEYSHQLHHMQPGHIRMIIELFISEEHQKIHQHNFEVWLDEGAMLMNESGWRCVDQLLKRRALHTVVGRMVGAKK